ncbi:mediator-associated protein 1-like protein [Carex littledalei]|uniref:Mediator-associated protein 1-like protein n=1 Tax=Carex littledalei TaxID=544730 RepID=A0A833S1D7_9POAL|nr:mediator-associated protein 1-like protein [Carex littledalei]
MAPKRKSSPAPAAASQSSSSDDDSSSDAEQYVAQRNPPRAETPKPTKGDDDESDSGSESDPEPEQPTKTLKTPQKPSESEDSSEEDEDEEEEQKEVEKIKSPVKTLQTPRKPSESEDSSEEEEEQEQVEKLKTPVKVPESEPDQKKQKLSMPDQSPTKKLSAAQRIWSLEDEMTLLNALCEYHVRNNRLPPTKDYASFLSGISGSISFPVIEKQIFNKIRQLRFNYNQKKKKGSNINFSEPHEKAVFELCSKLFEDGSSASKNGSSHEMNRNVGKKSDGKQKKKITKLGSLMEANDGTSMIANGVVNGGVTNGAMANGGDVERSHFYLEGLIKDLISTERCPRGLSSVEDVVARIGESRAHDLEEKTKMLRIDSIKLHAREGKLMAELLDALADEMMDD